MQSTDQCDPYQITNGIFHRTWGKKRSSHHIQQKSPKCSNLKNDRMISVCFQSKSFNITVIQVYDLPEMLKNLKLNGSMKTYKIF